MSKKGKKKAGEGASGGMTAEEEERMGKDAVTAEFKEFVREVLSGPPAQIPPFVKLVEELGDYVKKLVAEGVSGDDLTAAIERFDIKEIEKNKKK